MKSLKLLPVEPSYKHLGSNSFVLSWESNGIINYQCFILGKASFNEFFFKYPANQNDYYNPIVERILNSFKTPGIDSSH